MRDAVDGEDGEGLRCFALEELRGPASYAGGVGAVEKVMRRKVVDG